MGEEIEKIKKRELKDEKKGKIPTGGRREACRCDGVDLVVWFLFFLPSFLLLLNQKQEVQVLLDLGRKSNWGPQLDAVALLLLPMQPIIPGTSRYLQVITYVLPRYVHKV